MPNGIHSTKAVKQKVFGVTKEGLEELLATTRRFMKEYLDFKRGTKDQIHQRTKVENAVKREYPEIFGKDEHVKIRHLRNYISIMHSNTRSAYKKLGKEKGVGEVVERVQLQPPNTMQSGGTQALLPTDSVGRTTTQPPKKRGRPPKKGRPTAVSGGASSGNAASATAPASTIQSTSPRDALAPNAQFPPPSNQAKMELTSRQNTDSGLKEVEQFLRTCKPSLIHLLDHLAHYGCVNGDFLECLAGRAERLKEEAFHRYLRNHFSKGQVEGQRDLTEMEVLVLTEGLLRLRGR